MTEYIYILEIHPLDNAEFISQMKSLNRLLIKDQGESLSIIGKVVNVDDRLYPEYTVTIVEWNFMRNHLIEVFETLMGPIRCEIINQYKTLK